MEINSHFFLLFYLPENRQSMLTYPSAHFTCTLLEMKFSAYHPKKKKKKRERERQTDRQTDRQRQGQRQRQTDRQTDRDGDRETDTDQQTDR